MTAAGSMVVGRIAAWIVAVASIVSTIVVVFVPLGGQLAASLTWTSERKDACQDGPVPCTMSTVPFGPWLAWWALGWTVIILGALILCWSPQRWWTPRGAISPMRPGVFSTPEWFRLHAFAAVFIILLGFAVTAGRYSDIIVWEYVWSLGVALATILLATLCIRLSAERLDDTMRAGLARGYAFWLLPSEIRLRAQGRPTRVAASSRRGTGPRAAARRAERDRG